MTHDDAVLTLVRSVDPLEQAELEAWMASDAPARIAAQVVDRSRAVSSRLRRRVIALTVGGVVATSVGAAAAAGILGRPAPDRVKAHLAELDRGLPADLRTNAMLDTARSVAESADATLFAADTPDGGYCIEVVTGETTPRGASCVVQALRASRPIEVTSPLVRGDEPVIIAGRIDLPGRQSLRIVHEDGSTDDVDVSDEGYWIVELAGSSRESALRAGVELQAIGADGDSTAQITVPPLADTPPPAGSGSPIEATTVSEGDDLTLVLAIEGHVHRQDVASLELTYPDGTRVTIPLDPDGAFRYALPVERRHDLSDAPAELVARDTGRNVVASTPVASVAFWHRQNR